jgi:hypothetical protein
MLVFAVAQTEFATTWPVAMILGTGSSAIVASGLLGAFLGFISGRFVAKLYFAIAGRTVVSRLAD